MAHSRGLRFPSRSAGLKRRTAWDDGTGGTTQTAFSGSASIFVGSGLQPTVDGLTIIRWRGYFKVYLTLVTSVNDGFAGAFGIGIVKAPAFAAGIASVPTPLTEASSEDWLYHQFFSIHGPVVSSTDLGSAATVFETEIDSKAMRKVNVDDRLYAAAEFLETGTATGVMWHDSRILAKLP